MLLKIALAVVALLVLFTIFVAMQPASFTVTRAATIAAPPDVVFAQVNEFKKWEPWNPWAKKDLNIKQSYEGPSAGVGAVSSWEGDSNVGAGRMTIIESKPSELIKIRLEFLKPFKATNSAELTFEPQDGKTVLTWSMSGEKIFITKAIGLFMNMDKMIGDDFDKGLAQIQVISEAQTSAAAAH